MNKGLQSLVFSAKNNVCLPQNLVFQIIFKEIFND